MDKQGKNKIPSIYRSNNCNHSKHYFSFNNIILKYTTKYTNYYKVFLCLKFMEKETPEQAPEDILLGILSFIEPNQKFTRDSERIHGAIYSLQQKYSNSRLLKGFDFDKDLSCPYSDEIDFALWNMNGAKLIESYGTDEKGFQITTTFTKPHFYNTTLGKYLDITNEELGELETISKEFYEMVKA